MKIAWILYGSLDQRTGGTIYDARIVSGLRRRGHGVDVVELARGGEPSAIVRRLARSRPDVVVGDELCFRELAFVFPRTAFTKRLLLVHHMTCWEAEPKRLPKDRARFGEALAMRSADRVVATSHSTRARLAGEGYRRPIDVVLPGADRLELAPRIARGRPTFLFVGAILARKRVHDLVRAFASLTAPVELRLAGSREPDPVHARAVDRTIEELGCAERIAWLGEVDETTLARELASADALVMPSSLEGYGIAATEAVRAGTPVIAVRGAGLEEALAPCENAVRFASPGIASLATAMDELASRSEVRASMQRAAMAARLPDWAGAVERFAAVVVDLARSA